MELFAYPCDFKNFTNSTTTSNIVCSTASICGQHYKAIKLIVVIMKRMRQFDMDNEFNTHRFYTVANAPYTLNTMYTIHIKQ